ncbi:hypothetical protein ACFROC_05290 [Nocardia tengchongensis]|uniref:hypothetical protein n=1 Tax=Nocardia tengchongensis TaxID=2055889 RepID=UPI00368D2906
MAGLVGIGVGRLWASRAESSRWRRDQKTASYQRLAEQFRITYETIRAIALADPKESATTDMVHEARTSSFQPWDSACTVVWLHGAAGVVEATSDVDRAMTELAAAAQERMLTVAEWNEARLPVREAFERFIHAARRGLELPAVSVRFIVDAEI